MTFFPEIKSWTIPLDVLSASFSEMASDGEQGNEGIALWLGDRRDDGVAEISHIALLRGNGVVKRPLNITISPRMLRAVHEMAQAEGVVLLGQIHSHGPGYSVSLSEVDCDYGIAVPGYLSLVAPDYAVNGFSNLSDCGVHVYDRDEYRRLESPEIDARIKLLAGASSKSFVIETQ